MTVAQNGALIPWRKDPFAFAVSQHHPVVVRLNDERFADLQLRVADRITGFAGSMKFVYVHIVVFVTWMIVVERARGRR